MGPEAEQAMRDICEEHPEGVVGALYIEEADLESLDLPCRGATPAISRGLRSTSGIAVGTPRCCFSTTPP
jgi:hypothetical protein